MDNNNLNNLGQQNERQGQFQYQQPNANPYQQPNPYQQNPYQQNPYQNDGELEEPVSFGEWMVTMLVMCIPCVNIVMVLVWAFGSGTKKSKSNYCKATIVWSLIMVVLSFVMTIIFGGAILAALSAQPY